MWTPESEWKPPQTVQIWNEPTDEWVRVKKGKVWNAPTSSWVLSWVHPVVDATLNLSKSSVTTGETYNVALNVPDGFPEGASVTFRYTGYTSAKVYPAEGAAMATLTGVSHAAAGAYAWYADVETKGGNTTFGPLTQSVGISSTTVTLTAPTWVISGNSGATVSATPGSFTITLGTPSSVSKVSFQLSFGGGAWVEYKSWNSPVAASLNHSMIFYSAGAWKARVVVTLMNATVLYSAEKALTCYLKTISMTASTTTPITGDPVVLRATFSGSAPTPTNARWQYMNLAGSTWVDNWSTNNPATWNTPVVADYNWKWVETYADGSVISSNVVLVTVRSDAVVVNGGHCHNIQAGMDLAKSQGKALRLTGTFLVYTNVSIPANLAIDATGAKFNCNRDSSTYVRPGDAHNAGKFVNGGSGGAYNRDGWFNWNGGTFDGNGDSCMTISHSPGFTVRNATFYRYCADQNYFSWGDGHAIEINSSGGPDNATGQNGTFNVLISACKFQGTDMGQRAWGNDEPIHYDWAWEGSGGAAPWDGTMTHNVRVTGCTFHRFSETATVSGAGHGGYNNWQWRFAICAIGGHDPSQAAKDGMANGSLDPSGGWNNSTDRPKERHNHFKFDGNAIHGSLGYAGGSLRFDKGAIHAHRLRQVWVVNNNFYGCGAHQVSGWDSSDIPTYGSVSGNTSNNGGAPNTFWVHNT